MDRDEDLDYLSSAPLLVTPQDVKPEDEADLPTLKKVQALLNSQIASYDSIDRLTVSTKDFTTKQQLAISKAIKAHLMELKLTVDTTIENVRERYSS